MKQVIDTIGLFIVLGLIAIATGLWAFGIIG